MCVAMVTQRSCLCCDVSAWSYLSCLHFQSQWAALGRNAHRKPIPGVGGQAVNLQVAMGCLAERTGLGDHWEVPRPQKLHSRAEVVQPEEELAEPGRDLVSRAGLGLDTSVDRLHLRTHVHSWPSAHSTVSPWCPWRRSVWSLWSPGSAVLAAMGPSAPAGSGAGRG